MYEYQVTKYDPAFRDENGKYTREDWISFVQVGELVSFDEYARVERAYIEIALAFLQEANVGELQVRGLEDSKKMSASLIEGKQLNLQELESAFRSVLREEVWCRFEGKSAFVHFGWDYYMYLGVSDDCLGSRSMANKAGLFVEEFQSPYTKAG
jgi:hypothetical protein